MDNMAVSFLSCHPAPLCHRANISASFFFSVVGSTLHNDTAPVGDRIHFCQLCLLETFALVRRLLKKFCSLKRHQVLECILKSY